MRLASDERARVPFAMVAVLIVMLSIFSTAYLGGIQRQEAGQHLICAEINRQKTVLRQAEDIIATEGYYIASKAVAIATQFLCNQSMLDIVFQENYSAYLKERFPYFNDPYSVKVRDFRASIYLEEQNLHDLIPSLEIVESNVTLRNQNGTASSETMEILDTRSSQQYNETSELARYVIVGFGNCTVRNVLTGAAMEAPLSFKKCIDSPFPLMNSKMLALESQGDNGAMGLARIVKYVLTTLAQFRVLEGYGSGLGSEALAADSAPGNTSQIINQEDIDLAVNLAVILETARLFRDYDETAIDDDDLSALLEEYVTTGTLDAADIVALYSGIGDQQLPVDIMLAQALNVIADQFVLKYLDYLGITDIANAIYSTGQKIGQWIEDAGKSLSQFIFGIDGENRAGAQQVTDWLVRLTSDISWPPESEDITDNRLIAGEGNSTDLAVLDILQPIDTIYHYNATFSQLISDTGEPILDFDGQEIGTLHNLILDNQNISAETRPSFATQFSQGYLVDFQPANMVSQSSDVQDLWTQFYNDFYQGQEDVIYSTVRDAVKNITLEMASMIAMFINQENLSLAGYAGGKFSVDPKDEISVLQSISQMVDEVMLETVEHLQGNPGALNAMLSALTDSQSQLIYHLMEFINLNYDELVDKPHRLETGLESLSMSVFSNSTIDSIALGTNSASYSDYNELGHIRGFTDQEPVAYNSTESLNSEISARILLEQNYLPIASDFAPHLESSYLLMKENEANWLGYGNPDNGLLIKTLESKVLSQQNEVLMKFIGLEPDSLISMGAEMIAGVLENIVWSGEISNTQYCPEIVYSDGENIPFGLYEGQYEQALASDNIRYEDFTIGQSMDSLDYALSAPTGVHYTDAATFSSRPFETSWIVEISGQITVTCESSSLPYLGNTSHEPAILDKVIELNLKIPVQVYSGWGLDGADYESTASLGGDIGKALDMIKDFFGWVWETIAGPIGWIIDQIMKIVEFFQDIIGTLLGYASEIMNIITDIIGYLVELVQDYLRDIADWVFEGIVGWIMDQLPDNISFTFSMFGFDFNVSFAPESAIEAASNGDGGTLMTIETVGEILGAGFDVGVELVKLSDDVAETVDIGYDLLLTSQVRMKDFTLDTKVDPFMATQSHLVECTGQGEGWGLDLVIPEIESYDSIQYSLHDIPGVGMALSNIPIPPLGIKASINAGIEIVYNLQGIMEDNVVINEVELNPRGQTDGNQWVELFNPTAEPVLIDSWILTSPSNNVSYTFPAGMTIDSGCYYIAEFENVSLSQSDNILRLIDGSGLIIDSTPSISEEDNQAIGSAFVGPMGSQMSWQRSPNGADLTLAGEWVFNQSTKGLENIAIDLDFKQIVWNLIKGAFNTTWQNLKDELALSLGFIVKLVTEFIQRFIEDVLRVVEQSVVEASLFLDIMFTDMTGSGGAGMTLSFVIEGGRTLAQILRWIIGSVGAFLANLGSPSQPAEYPQLAPEVPEHLFIRLDVYGMVEVPKMVKKAVQSDDIMDLIKLAGRIEANIPALAELAGKDMGQWRINFGVFVEKMPAKIADPLFGTGDATPDVWLFKGTVYEM